MSEYIKFQEYLKGVRRIYSDALHAFYVFKSIQNLSALNIAGEKEAPDNVDVMNRFKYFFKTTKQALRVYSLMELAKILDDAQQSLHLQKLINFARSNRQQLSVEDFESANSNRLFLAELVLRYENLGKEDFEKIQKKLDATAIVRSKITTYRDQYLAHNDLKKEEVDISFQEVQELFDLVADILNIFSNKTDFSITEYNHIEDLCGVDTKNVIQYLKRFEPYRLEEINQRNRE